MLIHELKVHCGEVSQLSQDSTMLVKVENLRVLVVECSLWLVPIDLSANCPA